MPPIPIDLTPSNSSPPTSPRKRKRALVSDDETPKRTLEATSELSEDEELRTVNKKTKVREVPVIAITPPPLAFPKSLYAGYVPPAPLVSEESVLQDIIAEESEEQNNLSSTQRDNEDYFIDAELEDFTIYREHKTHAARRQKRSTEAARANELVSLHEINEWNVQRFYFDGIIWHGGRKNYVQRVPFETLSIGGYGEIGTPAAEPEVWIQTLQGKRLDVWYRLREPAAEYTRFHDPFRWMAELAKHVVDFLSTHGSVTLSDFRSSFYQWLKTLYESDNLLDLWMSQYRKQDFRQVVAAQANFLWCQATQINLDLGNHPVWSECHPRFLNAIPEEKEKGTRSGMFVSLKDGEQIISRRKTTVTPYVYKCFGHLPWAKFLYCQKPSVVRPKSQDKNRLHNKRHHGASMEQLDLPHLRHHHADLETLIKVGDVVALPPDKMTTWKSGHEDWLGYVQSITDTPKGGELGLLWLYRPSDTQCLKVPFPYPKELFLSDHCNCGDSPIYCQEVIRKLRIAFFGEPATESADFFVRQKYVEADGAWQTLNEPDFMCDCNKAKQKLRYSNGRTLLVSINRVLEPVVLVQYERGDTGEVKVRRLLRRRRDYTDSKAEPNELVFTARFQTISLKDIYRECQIRFYTAEQRNQGQIPAPYTRGGTGDFYFITSQDLQDGLGIQPVEAPQCALLSEGWDPQTPVQPPMRGLDIFCGGGNFGRGLEDSGAVHFEWAVDWYSEAIHTYKANLGLNDDTHLFYGSVNHYLTQAMQGIGGGNIAQYGEVEVIVAGSPCQGFSNANPNKGTDNSLFNVSMIASVVAFIDFYRPKYALMENVKGMASGPDTENILALVISALIGIGYQVRTFALDAWNYGSAQSRSRIFISIAAPGLTPLPEPPHTHSHPENVMSASLGKLANGLRSSSRYVSETPFKYITSAEATRDLPATDARTSCIEFPDHRMSRSLSTLHRIQIGSIPRFPCGNTFVIAVTQGYMPQAQIDAFPWSNTIRSKHDSRTWQRVKRGALMPTVMTDPRPDDGVNGTCLHWDEERLLTIMEVRRAQGFLDDDVLLGLPREQWKIVGNSVARPVALALGVSLREAWLTNYASLQDNTTNAQDLRSDTFSNAKPDSIRPIKSVTHGIDISVRALTTPVPSTSKGKHDLLQILPNDKASGCWSSRKSDECFKSTGKSEVDIEDSGTSAITGRSRSGKAMNSYASSFSDAKGDPIRTMPAAEDATRRVTQDMAPSNSPPRRFVARETTISKVTLTTTTTVLREQIESSPEL